MRGRCEFYEANGEPRFSVENCFPGFIRIRILGVARDTLTIRDYVCTENRHAVTSSVQLYIDCKKIN